jgi:hypothetical protein
MKLAHWVPDLKFHTEYHENWTINYLFRSHTYDDVITFAMFPK